MSQITDRKIRLSIWTISLQVLRKYEKVFGVRMRLRMIVIYTADIEEAAAKNDMDIGCLNF